MYLLTSKALDCLHVVCWPLISTTLLSCCCSSYLNLHRFASHYGPARWYEKPRSELRLRFRTRHSTWFFYYDTVSLDHIWSLTINAPIDLLFKITNTLWDQGPFGTTFEAGHRQAERLAVKVFNPILIPDFELSLPFNIPPLSAALFLNLVSH